MKSLIVKFGTKSLMSQKGILDGATFDEIARQIALLVSDDWRVVIVTSGAIQAGREEAKRVDVLLGNLHKKDIAALGSPRLMQMWAGAFRKRGRCVGQIWLTHANLQNQGERRSIGESIRNFAQSGIVPVLNENDVVSDREIRTMDAGISENDRLTFLLCAIVDPSYVLSVTSTGGVFDRFPCIEQSKMYLELDTQDLPHDLAESEEKSTVGTGGMYRKIVELSKCCGQGRRVGIASWQEDGILRFAEGESVGTILGNQNRLGEDSSG